MLLKALCHYIVPSVTKNRNPPLGERSEPHTGVFNRDFAWYIYVGMSVVCQINCVGGITYAHAQSQFWAVKNDQ